MANEILRDPIILRGSMDRPNINIKIMEYKAPTGKENDWSNVAKQIQDMIKDEITIVYCSFAKTCDLVCSALLQLDISASAYTGATRTTEEKKEIHQAMNEGKIKVLVATQAFGLGINIKGVRWVFHIGCPPNITLWVQELGRAGRDGEQATAVLLFKEHNDMQKLKFWTKDIDEEDKRKKQKEYKTS